MKKLMRRCLSVIVCMALVFALLPVSSKAIMLTATNDTLLPLSDNTMPARLGGELYVPYEVFSSFSVQSNYDSGLLTLSSGENELIFSPSEGFTYDGNNNSYETPAYDRNSSIYVPVKLCCSQFSLEYSSISASGETVLRITDGSSNSDSAFVAANAAQIEQAINQYYGYPNTPDTTETPPAVQDPQSPEQPAEPTPPPVEEKPTQKANHVYLTFFGETTEYTAEILDALKNAQTEATFFLPANTEKWSDDTVRRIIAEGHSAALLLQAASTDTPEALVNQLSAANEHLSFLTGQETRLVSNTEDCDKLSGSQRSAILSAGYRFWDAIVDSEDDKERAAYAYAAAAKPMAETTNSVVVKFRHTKETAEAVSLLSAYISRQSIPCTAITISTPPINKISETS